MKPVRIASAVLAASLLFASCQKDKDEVKASAIVGTWTFSESGEDINNNNVPEASELDPIVMGNATVTFRADKTFTGTSTFLGQTITETGTYTYANNKLITDGTQGKDTVNIHTLTANKMIFRDTEDTPAAWIVLTK